MAHETMQGPAQLTKYFRLKMYNIVYIYPPPPMATCPPPKVSEDFPCVYTSSTYVHPYEKIFTDFKGLAVDVLKK